MYWCIFIKKLLDSQALLNCTSYQLLFDNIRNFLVLLAITANGLSLLASSPDLRAFLFTLDPSIAHREINLMDVIPGKKKKKQWVEKFGNNPHTFSWCYCFLDNITTCWEDEENNIHFVLCVKMIWKDPHDISLATVIDDSSSCTSMEQVASLITRQLIALVLVQRLTATPHPSEMELSALLLLHMMTSNAVGCESVAFAFHHLSAVSCLHEVMVKMPLKYICAKYFILITCAHTAQSESVALPIF